MARLLLIGLDAGDRAFIHAHAAELPNMARFFAEAPVQPLAAEAFSGAVWTSFITGAHPAEHGVYHHLQWNPARMRIERTHPRWIGDLAPFWRDLARRGRRVTVVDAPFVFEGEAHGALEIANWGSHDLVGPFWCNDRDEERRIRKTYGAGHPMGFEAPVDKSRAQLADMRDDMIRGVEIKGRLVCDLIARKPWDVFITVFGEPHRAGHVLWPHADAERSAPDGAFLAVYRAVDRAIGETLAAAGPNCDVILFALHGMTVNSSQSHLSRGMLHALARTTEARGGDSGLVRLLRQLVPAPVQHAIAERVPTAVRDFVVARDIVGGADWESTRVFSLEGDLSGYWRFNVAGREAKGLLSAEEADALRATIAHAFAGFVAPDGRPLARRISFPAHDGGARAHLLPDVLVEWDPELPAQEEARHAELGVVRGHVATGRGGNHRFNGFYAHKGPRSGRGVTAAHISDLGRLVESLAA